MDGIFISDPGVLELLKNIWPNAKIILSTQANCTNWLSAKYWMKEGVGRIILSRELSLKEIKAIREKNPKLELEAFVHGAMCMSYSGRCFLSKYYNDRNANLGDCSQPCRWEYQMSNDGFRVTSGKRAIIKPDGHSAVELIEEDGKSYILNSHDLCLIKRVPDLIKAGLSAFKIEGRAKSVYYLANVVGAYRQAIDLVFENNLKNIKAVQERLNYLYKELDKKLYHRGYTEGFIFGEGESAQNLKNSHNIPAWEFCGQVVKSAGYLNYIKVHNTLKIRDKVEVLMPGYEIKKIKIRKMIDKETGDEACEAHGGVAAKTVLIETDFEMPAYSVLRRNVK